MDMIGIFSSRRRTCSLETAVLLCTLRLDCDSSLLGELLRTLSYDERLRASRFRHSLAQRRYIASRGALRHLLAWYLDRDPHRLEFEYSRTGKPALRPLRHGEKLPAFNVSHSGGLAVFAIANGCRLGVDVEAARSGLDCQRLAEHCFSTREFEEFVGLSGLERHQGFLNCWTRKEAYIKADGRGMQLPLKSFDVSLTPGAPAGFCGGATDNWHLWPFMPLEGYTAALAYDGPLRVIEEVPLDFASA